MTKGPKDFIELIIKKGGNPQENKSIFVYCQVLSGIHLK